MAGITHNAYQIAARFEARGEAVEREVGAELDKQGQLLAREVRRLAPKFQSLLTNSVHVSAPEPYTRVVSVGAAHGIYQELGIKAGGKGLPKFNDPASASIVAWLRGKLRSEPGRRRVRANSMAAVVENLELRDRYEGLAWHIRHRGVKASPFVRPTFEAMHRGVSHALQMAVRRGMAAQDVAGGTGGGVA